MKTTMFPAPRWTALAAASIFALQACGGGGSSGPAPSPPPPPPPPPGNQAPVISSPSSVNITEGVTGTVYTLSATDPDGDTLTRELLSSGDAGVFSFNAATGVLSLGTALDFDAPQDANGDNIYEVTFRVSDGNGGQVTRTVQIRVQDAGGAAGMALARVGTGFSLPLFLEGIPGTDRVVVLEKGGRARVLNPDSGAIEGVDFIDLTGDVATAGEQGLVGIAFSPNFTTDRTVFVNLTNNSGNTEIRKYQTYTSNRLQLDPATQDVILTINQVDEFHNGGWLGFGNDGMLYLATGDGGGNDPNADQNGQDTGTLLGKILRIDPFGADAYPADNNRDYAIPAGNAFPGGAGGEAEIFAVGLRNPWRSSFDAQTGDLFIADVGQGAIEEINRMRPGDAGANYGWAQREGTQAYDGPDSPDYTPPVAEYGHGGGPTQGNSITGGYVYRGNIAPIRNHYVFADFESSNVWSVPVSSLVVGSTLPSSQFNRLNDDLVPDAGTLEQISSFGVDNSGQLYIVSLGGSIFRIEGAP
ncbi:cadherin domain-containing protein [Hyphomonas hirschiana VP5]|nr:cadherin domain-containing protein [Hyphomonas hirschiana VP5]